MPLRFSSAMGQFWATRAKFPGHADDGTAVVYTLPPNRVDDAVTCTLGHEVMHLALGEYHR